MSIIGGCPNCGQKIIGYWQAHQRVCKAKHPVSENRNKINPLTASEDAIKELPDEAILWHSITEPGIITGVEIKAILRQRDNLLAIAKDCVLALKVADALSGGFGEAIEKTEAVIKNCE